MHVQCALLLTANFLTYVTCQSVIPLCVYFLFFQIKYHQEWNNTKTNYTLTETPQLEAAKEAARILNHVRTLFIGTVESREVFSFDGSYGGVQGIRAESHVRQSNVALEIK